MNISGYKGTFWQSTTNTYQSDPHTTKNIESDDEVYFDALSNISEPTAPESSIDGQVIIRSEPEITPVNALLGHIVNKILFNIALRTLSRVGDLEALYAELRVLAQSNAALPVRMQELIELLKRCDKQIPDNYRPLLYNVCELAHAALSIYQLSVTRLPTLCAEIRQFADLSEGLLSLQLIKEQLPAAQLNQLSRLPAQMRKMADILLQAQLMPEDTALEEWLLIIQQHNVLPEPLQQMLAGFTQLWGRLRALHESSNEISRRYPLPVSNNWAECINWILQLLNDPRATRHITANLPAGLMETLTLSKPLLQMVSQFPTSGTLAQQLTWATEHLSRSSSGLNPLLARLPLGEFIEILSQQISGKMVNPTLFDALIVLANPASSLREKSNQIISLCLRNFRFRGGVDYAMRKTVTTFTGGSLVLSTWDWYQQLPTGLSWQQTAERFVSEMTRQVNSTPQLLRELLPDYFIQSAGMLSDLVALPVGQPWQETLRWGIRRLGLSRVNDWLSQRYIELCLIRGVCESLQQGDAMQREAILRDLSASLKDYFALRPDSELAGLIDLLPYLPLLSGLHDTIKQIPHTNSWLTWATSLLDAIEQHPHPALITLRDQMETQVANYLSDGLVATFDSLWDKLPEFSDPLRFPAADAAALPQTQEVESAMLTEERAFILELFDIAGEYSKGKRLVWVKGDTSLAKEYGAVAGLSAGWIAALFTLFRAYYQPSPERRIASNAEMQALRSPPELSITSPSVTATGYSSETKKYIVPMAIVTGMGAATACVIWNNWGDAKGLTLQQIYRDILEGEFSPQTKKSNTKSHTEIARVKRELNTLNATRIAQEHFASDTEISLDDIHIRFKTWNISTNKIIEDQLNVLFHILKKERPDVRDETQVVAGAAFYFIHTLSNYIHNLHDSRRLSATTFDVKYFIYCLILLEKMIERVKKITPGSKIYNEIFTTYEYNTICNFIENELAAVLYTKHITTTYTIEVIYDFMCNSTIFGFNKFPHLRDVMEKKNQNLSLRNEIGPYAEVAYRNIESLVSSELTVLHHANDIITEKKEAFDFLIKKISFYQQENRRDVSLDEMEHILVRSRDKIVNIMLTPNYDEFLINAKAIAYRSDVDFITSSKLANYREKWGRYSLHYMEIIKNNLTKKNHENLYSKAATLAINDLLNARHNISDLLIKNFTSPSDAYQQYALYIMLSLQINKIASFKQEWDKIILYWHDLINDKEINSKIISLYHANSDNITNFLIMLKSVAIQKTFKEVEKIQSIDIRNNFYDALVLDLSPETIVLKKEIDSYIKTGSYLLYQYMSKGINDYKNADFSPESFYSMDRNILEMKSVPLLTGSFFERNLHPIEQVQREASSASMTQKRLYRIYNDYISSDAKKEAIITATNFFYIFGEQFISWESLIKTASVIQEYSYIRKTFMKDSRTGHYLIKTEPLGSATIITIEGSEKYIYLNLLGHPAIINLDEELTKKISTTPKYDELYLHIYKALSIGNDLEFQAKLPFRDHIMFAEILIDIGKADNSCSVILKDIIIDDFHRKYVAAANALKNKGNQSILDDLLSLIPFYSIVKRKIYDPQYEPVVADMVWDIIDVGAGLSFPGIKLANTAFHTFKKITRQTQKLLSKSDPTLKGTEKYIKTLQLSLPMVRKKIPKIQDAIVSTIEFSAALLNPIDPFVLMGSKLAALGDNAITKIPTRVKNSISYSNGDISIKLPTSGISITNAESKYFTGNPAYNYKYIDETTGIELDEMISRIPVELYADRKLENFIRIPQGQSEIACQQTAAILQSHGYDTKIIACLAYKFPSDTVPLAHYAVYATKADDKLVIDATYEQFISLMDRNYKARITSWEQWVRDITHSDKLKNNLILIKEYESTTIAKHELSNFNGYNHLESPLVKDPAFRTINIPKCFINKFSQIHSVDSHRVRNATTLSLLDSVDEKISTQKNILLNLKEEEGRYLNKSIAVPVETELALIKTTRIINELEDVQRLPQRLSNYLYFNKDNFLTEHNKLIFNTPVSNEISSFLSTPEAISISEDITTPFINAIQSIDEYGLVYVSNVRYLLNDNKLFKVYSGRAMSKQTALIELDTNLICINFNEYRWVIDHYSTIPSRAKINALHKQLASGSTLPLRNKGNLEVKKNTRISTPFTYFRRDNKFNMPVMKEFSPSDLDTTLRGKIELTTGNNLSSQTINGPVIGRWKMGDLDENIEFIQISNGNSGCIAIKIAFDQLPEGKPVIISAGDLSGCTMIYATDNHYFYAYHAGQQPGDTNWLTSRHGVKSIYDAHILMKGTAVSGFETKTFRNQDLPSIFSDYTSSLITYLGKNTKTTGNTRVTTDLYSNVTTFDYNKYHVVQGQSRVGLAYAVLSKNKGIVNVSAYSEDLLINNTTGDLTTLFSQHQRLKGVESTINDSIFDASVDILSDLYTAFIGMRIISKANKE